MGEVFKLNHCYNMDCLPAMELFPDNYFDLAVVDGGKEKMILEKLHRAINNFNKTFNWRRFRRDALHLGESLLVFGVLYGIFSTLIWGVCWLLKINYNPDLIAVAWAVPVLLDTLVKKAYDWNNEVRDWD